MKSTACMSSLCPSLSCWSPGYKLKEFWGWVWSVALCWFERTGLRGCRLLGLWPAAGSGYSLDAVTRYKLSELTKWTSPAGKWKMNLKILTLCSKPHLRGSVLHIGGLVKYQVTSVDQVQSPALQLGSWSFPRGKSLTLEPWLLCQDQPVQES